jgi:hypothetical protein
VQHQTFKFPLPVIESGKLYSADSVALEIVNLQNYPDGTMRAVRGPAPYVPRYDGVNWPSQYGNMHGIYHGSLDSGMRDVLLLRTGDKLCEQRGWTRGWGVLKSGLSDDAMPRFPDQFAEVGGKIVWTNGIDSPLIYDGYMLLPLGYSKAPGAVHGAGPAVVNTSTTNTNSELNPTVYRNSLGYSHPGRIGTPGDLLSGQIGCMRAGSWTCYVQFEDAFGNLSPLSPPSNAVTVRTEDATNLFNKDFLAWNNPAASLGPFAVQVDDLTKQFLWTNIPTGPEGTVARILYRTADTNYNDNTPRFLVRIPDNSTTVYPDNHADSELGSPAPDIVAVPTFRVSCAYAGGLAIANTTANPGLVRISDPGFPGTFRHDRWIYPDPNGAEVTGLANFQGKLLAFTRTTVFEIEDDGTNPLRAMPITSNIGCVAPSSIRATSFEMLIWLGRDNFYGMHDEHIESISEPIKPTMDGLNHVRLPLAVAEWSPDSDKYLCAVPSGGSLGNDLVLAYTGQGWRRRAYNMRINGITLTKDDRSLLMICGQMDAVNNVFALDREVRSFTPTPKEYIFKSQWLRMDATGRDRFNVTAIYVGFIESCTAQLSWKVYKNGRRDVPAIISSAANALTLAAADAPTNAYSTLVVGTGTVRTPRLFWRRFDIKLTGVDSFAFDLIGAESSNVFPHMAAFAFEGSVVDGSGAATARG